MIKPNARILFQGDSITDAGRSREDDSSLGYGYANMVAAWLSAKFPERDLTFLNRGIGGNRIYDLESRWTEDCIDLKPDIISILIGVNDTWRRYDSSVMSPLDEFDACYRRILDRARSETNAELMILEPFVLETPERHGWREDLDPRIQVVRKIARDYKAIYVPLDGIFAAASTQQPPSFWAADGVHPTQPGHALLAQAWIEALKKLG